jgi:hypothetical protein
MRGVVFNRCVLKTTFTGIRFMSTKPSNVIPVAEVKRFTVDCLETASVPLEHAEMLADVLVAADYRGHYSHGMNRLGT